MSEMIRIVRHYSELVKNDRTLGDIHDHLVDEADELRDEIENGGTGDDGIVGEAIDVIACALDVIFQHDPEILDSELDAIMLRKCEKWRRNYSKN